MPKDWGLKWKIRYISKHDCSVMNKLLGIAIAVIVVGAVSTFALSPYFTESTIDEAIPTGAITQSKVDGKDTVTTSHDDVMEEKMMKEDEMMMEEKMMKEDEMMMEEKMMKEDEMMMEEKMMKEDEMMMEEKMMKEDEMMMEEKIVPMTYAGEFIGVGDGIHDAQGDAFTIPIEDGSNVLRLENFKSTNGPDLYVYLSTDDKASDFVNLGELKASSGNQNYEIPDDTDLSKYNKVLVWCKAFGVLFGSAELSSQ